MNGLAEAVRGVQLQRAVVAARVELLDLRNVHGLHLLDVVRNHNTLDNHALTHRANNDTLDANAVGRERWHAAREQEGDGQKGFH